MKKCLFVVLLVLILSAIWCLHEAYEYKKESDWFCELSNEWHLFESNYTEDIKNIDRLRDDLRWEKELCLEWERRAMEFKQEACKNKIKCTDKWVNKNVGLLARNKENRDGS